MIVRQFGSFTNERSKYVGLVNPVTNTGDSLENSLFYSLYPKLELQVKEALNDDFRFYTSSIIVNTGFNKPRFIINVAIEPSPGFVAAMMQTVYGDAVMHKIPSIAFPPIEGVSPQLLQEMAEAAFYQSDVYIYIYEKW